jgi:hypothetical protein
MAPILFSVTLVTLVKTLVGSMHFTQVTQESLLGIF